MKQPLSDALAERGYDVLTKVQEAVTAPELQDADLLVSAQTGSGKTVGFGLAIAHTLMGEADAFTEAAAPLALVVAPTRELALQVMRELSWLYARAGARVVSCVGGMDMRDERRALARGAHIVVGTPGRLRDHIQRGSLEMDSLRAIVLDEADEMLDLGFREDLEFMLDAAPADRRTLMFSATVPPMIVKLAGQFQRDAVRVTTLTGASQHADITYQALRVAQVDTENAIINVLRYHEAQNAIVFVNTRAAVNRLMARFANRGFAVVALSGELSQTERTHALQAMRDGRARVCVATDVAARGIDLPNLELVIHADLPSNAEGVLHRSGRTGRAGRKGISALIVPPKLTKKAERLLKFAKINAEWTVAPSADDILRRDEERLLADPAWNEEMSADEEAFAARLLALHSPEKLAAAYLRLYRDRHSAPEDLSAPGVRPERRERAPFGPSKWVALSVGREDRAEARWLLPLLCRAGGLDKTAIGAIRVQQGETFVELSEAAVPAFLAALGDDLVLEDGVKVRALEGAPEFGTAPDGGARPAGKRKSGDHRKGARVPGPDGEGGGKGGFDKRKPPRAAPESGDAAKPGKPRAKAQDKEDESRPSAVAHSALPEAKRSKPPAARPGKPAPYKGAKPGGPKSGKGKPAGKAPGKPTGKPAGKSAKPAAPSKPKFNAADPSKRVSRPGAPGKPKAGKPGAGKRKTPREGGFDAPRRKNR